MPLSAVATVSILSGSSQTFAVGQSAELVCTPTGSQLVDRVQWVRLGNSLPSDAKETENGILRFSSFEVRNICFNYVQLQIFSGFVRRRLRVSGVPRRRSCRLCNGQSTRPTR
jgi:hypothetical protein